MPEWACVPVVGSRRRDLAGWISPVLVMLAVVAVLRWQGGKQAAASYPEISVIKAWRSSASGVLASSAPQLTLGVVAVLPWWKPMATVTASSSVNKLDSGAVPSALPALSGRHGGGRWRVVLEVAARGGFCRSVGWTARRGGEMEDGVHVPLDGRWFLQQVRFSIRASLSGRGGEGRARWLLASWFCCWWRWWSSLMILLRPAVAARGVVVGRLGVLGGWPGRCGGGGKMGGLRERVLWLCTFIELGVRRVAAAGFAVDYNMWRCFLPREWRYGGSGSD